MEEIYKNYEITGTFAPLVNQKEYTENEKIVLLYFFTNIDKNVYCAKDALSSQLWAFLVGQYSRSSLSMRDRFLKLFEDALKAYNEGKIEREDFVTVDELADSIQKNNSKMLKYFNDRSSKFLKTWGVDYGHNSLKDADRIRFAIEGVSQVFTKVIEAPFPSLGDFQEKSTRYLHFGKENIIYSPKLMESEFKDEILKINEDLMDLYESSFGEIKTAIIKNRIINKEDFERESAFENTLNAKVFDILRYLLPSGTATSLGAGFSTRIAESHISEMLSSDIEEVRLVAKSMYDEALKISPGLLSRVAKNDYFISKRKKSLEITNEIFYKKEFEDVIKGIGNQNRVKFITSEKKSIDDIVTASILFEYSRQKGVSFIDCLNRVNLMSNETKEKIMRAELEDRGEFDRMPRTLQHGSIMVEFLCDFGAYRDIQRHRASMQLWQGATAIHGYDYPEFMEFSGFENFKKKYDELMTKITLLSRKIIVQFPYESEYVSALGHLVRTTFEMHPGQLAYVCELRTTPQGHHSYRTLFQKFYNILKEEAPIFSKFIKINHNTQASRLKQEEKAAHKREILGL